MKKYKKACKTDPYRIGLEQNYFFYGPEQEWIYLPKAESLLWQFTNLWREWHVAQNFGLISIPQHLDRKEIQRVILQKKQLTKVASFDLEGGDIATSVSCPDKLLETLISSLQFFQQAFKIFPFEIGVCLDAKKSGTLAKALAHLGIQPSKETRNKETERVIWSSFDGFGRTVLLSSIEVEEKQGIVQHALFQSVKNWLALCIEHGVEKFEFESQ
ncbi:MAG: hypothetical protein S4CHLAM123_13320 [Chlamydiales bacterium]|nr:hypothetical protein [Chlamydiales bacterium]